MDEKQMLERPAECAGYDFCGPTYRFFVGDEVRGELVPCPCPICNYMAPAAVKEEQSNG
jgi:hypothetical protein